MKNIRTRFFMQILIPVIVLYTLFISAAAAYIGESYRESALRQKQVSLSMVVQRIDDWFLSRVSEIIQLSRIPLFHTGSTEDIHSYLREWNDTLSFRYISLLLVEEDGSYWQSNDMTGYLDEKTYTDLFFENGALFTYDGPRRYGSVLKDNFIIGTPIYDENGKAVQILTATISLETIHWVFSFFTFEDFDSWMVVNPRSIIVIHKNFDMVGLSERGEYGKTYLQNEELSDRYVFVKTMRNGWKIVTFMDKQRIIQLYRKVFSLVLWFSLVLFIITAILVLILSRTVSRPIIRLTRGVNRIMAGDYAARIRIRTGDELSELAESFNRLASRMTSIRTGDRFSFLGHIAARMAHELRKPLHVIQLAAQSLQGDISRLSRNLKIIDQEIASADRFINEVLNFAHVEHTEKIEYSISRLLTAVIEKYRFITDKNGISLVFRNLRTVPNLYMDIIRMEEVLSNILQNSVDSIRESDAADNDHEIIVTLDFTDSKEILISVLDTGKGFDEKLINQVFDPYFTTRPAGTGLGLSLSYRILMAHGADINVSNDENHHGLVEIIIPV